MTKVILKTRPPLTTSSPPLFGDLEYLVDRLLKGDKTTKERIAIADIDCRGGYASLLYHLKKAGVTKYSPADQRILKSLKLDQDYFEALEADTKNIEERAGRYRVQLMFEGNKFRKTFENRWQARMWRDCMTLLFSQIEQSEALSAS